MKAILEFNLPEETPEHQDALNGTSWKYAMMQLDAYLRGLKKYGHDLKTADEAIERIRYNLYTILECKNLTLD